MKHLLAVCLILLTAGADANTVRTETIVVNSRPAAAMVDVVRPLLEPGGGVSAFHDKLIVRGTARQIADVRALLRDLDRPPRRLIIEVRQAGSVDGFSRDLGYGANTGDVRIGRAPRREGLQLHYRDAQTRGRDDGMQRVQALDGRPALIRAGRSTPVYRAQQQVIGNQLIQGLDVAYRDSLSGFYALPRVHGDQVTVEIYQQYERPGSAGQFHIQQASSVLRGALGQWMPLGSFGGSDSDSRQAFGRHVETRRAEDRQIDLRVIAVD